MDSEDVTSLEITGLRVPPQGNGSPVIDLRRTKDVWIRYGRAPSDTARFVSVAGADSARIVVSGCDLLQAKRALAVAANVAPSVVTLANNIAAG